MQKKQIRIIKRELKSPYMQYMKNELIRLVNWKIGENFGKYHQLNQEYENIQGIPYPEKFEEMDSASVVKYYTAKYEQHMSAFKQIIIGE